MKFNVALDQGTSNFFLKLERSQPLCWTCTLGNKVVDVVTTGHLIGPDVRKIFINRLNTRIKNGGALPWNGEQCTSVIHL